MPEFMLEPDEIEPERSAPRRPVRLVSTGLAPTADVPPQGRKKETPPCYAPCEACGMQVLTGETATGTRLALDTHIRTYTVLWLPDTPRPVLHESRGYPVHVCQPGRQSSPVVVELRDRAAEVTVETREEGCPWHSRAD
jgi:hypothetical protein